MVASTRRALNSLRKATLEAMRPPLRRPLSEYIEATIHLPPGLSSASGPIKLWQYQKLIADTMIDPDYPRCTIIKGARLGYSTLLAGVVAHYIKQDPASILCVLPTDDDTRTFLVSQIESVFGVSPELRNAIPITRTGPFGEWQTMRYRRTPGGGSLRIVSARAPRNLRAHSARVLIVDEADACEITTEGNPIMLATERTRSFPDRKIIVGGTPLSSSTSIVYNSYQHSDQRVYECPCPSCGDYHQILWRDVRWPEDKPQEAAWLCPSCGVYHDDTYKRDMVENGRWRITAPEVKGHAGFKLNCLIAPHVNASWSNLAEEFLIAKRRPETLKPFIQLILGEPWNEDEEGGPLPHELQALAEPTSLEAIGEDVRWLTSGVDVQGDRIEITTLGFTEDDEWIALDHRQLYGEPSRDEVWRDLADFLRERYPHPLGATICRDLTCLDAGDGNVQDRVMAFCAGHRELRVIPIKGATGSRPPLTPTASKRTRLLQICGVDGLKGRIADRLAKRTGIRFSDALPLAYFEQLAGSERPQVRYVRGQPTRIWTRVPGRLAETLDCFVYALAARSAVMANPARRQAELASRTGLKPVMPVVIRSSWLEGRSR